MYLLLISHQFSVHWYVAFLTLCSSVASCTLLTQPWPDRHRHIHRHTHHPLRPASHSTTVCFIQLFGAQLLPPVTSTPPDCLLFVTFLWLPRFSPFLLSVSIGGHGLGKPSEPFYHVEDLLCCLFFLSMEDSGTGFQQDIPSFCFSSFHFPRSFISPSISSYASSLITACLHFYFILDKLMD